MKTLYFDVFAGISGDMCLGALLDLGCPGEELRDTLAATNIPGFDLTWERVMRGPLSGVKAHVHVKEEHHVHRTLSDVLAIVDRVVWPDPVRERIESVFTVLAKAEGRIHNKPFDQIHFHEVGSFDAIVDISGTLWGLHRLGVQKCVCSKVHVGEGFVKTRHGTLPLPVPATAELLQGFDLYSTGRRMEMVTPTGAALLHVLAGRSTKLPAMKLEKTGYGAGTQDPEDIPGMLRVFLGETETASGETIAVVEANIDDMNPEFFEPLMERLFEAGALDVTLSPIAMKKNRPATLLSVLVSPALRETIAQTILQNSSTLGVRMHDCERRILQRKPCDVNTPWGFVRGKVCWGHGVEERFTPEYEDCHRIHRETHVPIAFVYEKAVEAWRQQRA